MSLDLVLLYSAVSFFYIISPGPAIFLAISNGISADMKGVRMSSYGNVIGLSLLSALSISGLGMLLATSAVLFMVVKFMGAAYLIYLGIRQFLNGKARLTAKIDPGASAQRSARSFFTEGFFLAATNPKPILFFTAIFPQFLNLDHAILPQFAVLTAIFMVFSFGSLCSYGFISGSTKSWLGNQKKMAWFHRITGGIFISMGVGLLQLRHTQN